MNRDRWVSRLLVGVGVGEMGALRQSWTGCKQRGRAQRRGDRSRDRKDGGRRGRRRNYTVQKDRPENHEVATREQAGGEANEEKGRAYQRLKKPRERKRND